MRTAVRTPARLSLEQILDRLERDPAFAPAICRWQRYPARQARHADFPPWLDTRIVRAADRNAGHVVITNPDMLHTGILPHHTKWVHLFEGLRYVVLDELHMYRGIFGSHVANVLRRLRRICAFYGSDPIFVFTSAT